MVSSLLFGSTEVVLPRCLSFYRRDMGRDLQSGVCSCGTTPVRAASPAAVAPGMRLELPPINPTMALLFGPPTCHGSKE